MAAKPTDIVVELLGNNRCVEALVTAWTFTDPSLTADVSKIDLRDLVFRACRQMVSAARESDTGWKAADERIGDLLNRFPPPNLLVADFRDPPAAAERTQGYRSLMIRTHLLCVRAASVGSWLPKSGAVPTEELEKVIVQLRDYSTEFRSETLPTVELGLIRDLTELLLGQAVRPAIRQQRMAVSLIVDGAEGATGTLCLELIAPGRGEIYVHPEQAFVYRDEDFVCGEQAARDYAERVFAGTAEDGDERGLDVDVRWRLLRRKGIDEKEVPFTRLTGNSASGALGMGTLKLLAG